LSRTRRRPTIQQLAVDICRPYLICFITIIKYNRKTRDASPPGLLSSIYRDCGCRAMTVSKTASQTADVDAVNAVDPGNQPDSGVAAAGAMQMGELSELLGY